MAQPEAAAPRRRRGRPVGSDSAATRERILRAGQQVIRERGYHAATFQAIAQAANLSRPSLHHYFSSREEIFRALMVEASVHVAEWIAHARRRRTLVDQLSALVLAMRESDGRDGHLIAFLLTAKLEASRNPELSSDHGNDVRTFLRDAVAAAAARGEIAADVEQRPLVDTLYSMMWGVGFYGGFLKEEAAKVAIVEQLVDVLSDGLIKRVSVP